MKGSGFIVVEAVFFKATQLIKADKLINCQCTIPAAHILCVGGRLYLERRETLDSME